MPTPDIPGSIKAFNKALLTLALDYDHVTYGLGCKGEIRGGKLVFQKGKSSAGRQCDGNMVDCSGWLAAACTLALRSVDEKLALRVGKAMATHSDGQIVNIKKLGSKVWSGDEILKLDQSGGMRPGMLIGANFGDHDWEGAGRAYGIDHILVYVENANGTAALLQSSSKLGVNMISWDSWRGKYAQLIKIGRVHIADIFGIDGFGAGTVWTSKDTEQPLLDDELGRFMLEAEPD